MGKYVSYLQDKCVKRVSNHSDINALFCDKILLSL